MRFKLIAAILLMAGAAQAQSGFTCNRSGAVVTLEDGAVYYLGRSCDAAKKGGGTGRWYLTASFFVVEIAGQPMRLPFEIDCDMPACWSNN